MSGLGLPASADPGQVLPEDGAEIPGAAVPAPVGPGGLRRRLDRAPGFAAPGD